MRRLYTGCAIALAALCAGLSARAQTPLPPATNPAAQAAAGYAVPIGGALKFDNTAVWSRLVQLSGGPGARWVVLATAAGNPERAAQPVIEALQRQGAVAEHIPVAPRIAGIDLAAEVRNPKWLDRVAGARGVYFAGGAQERIVDSLAPDGTPTPLLQAIWGVYRRGGVVAGSSAGAAIMSRVMFRDAQDVMHVLKGRLRDGQEVDRGLGFVGPDLFVDQHFLKRGRVGRMLPLMQARGYRLGLGVDEDSAAIVQGDEVEVIGAKGALLVDLRGARSDAALGAFNIRGAALSYLDRGDRLNLATGVLTPSAAKRAGSRIDAQAVGFKPYYDDEPFYLDILGDTTIANAMGHLIDNTAREARGLAFDARPKPGDPAPQLGFEWRLYKGADSLGWYTAAFGGEDYTVSRLYLDVLPVRMAQPLYQPWSH